MQTAYRPTNELRYIAAGPYRTQERAEDVLEDMFARGDVCMGERPRIQRRNGGWAITLPERG